MLSTYLEQLVAGTLCAGYSPATYRTKNGKGLYTFRFVNIGGKFEIDILSQPSYAGKASSSLTTHRLSSSRGGHKICISSGKEPKDIETTKKISVEWAELTQTYIETGKTLDTQINSKASPSSKLWNKLFP